MVVRAPGLSRCMAAPSGVRLLKAACRERHRPFWIVAPPRRRPGYCRTPMRGRPDGRRRRHRHRRSRLHQCGERHRQRQSDASPVLFLIGAPVASARRRPTRCRAASTRRDDRARRQNGRTASPRPSAFPIRGPDDPSHHRTARRGGSGAAIDVLHRWWPAARRRPGLGVHPHPALSLSETGGAVSTCWPRRSGCHTVGGEAVAADWWRAARRLSPERSAIPVSPTSRGLGLLPTSHPLGACGNGGAGALGLLDRAADAGAVASARTALSPSAVMLGRDRCRTSARLAHVGS